MYECFCDDGNPSNYGCTLKFLRFLEDTMTAVEQSGEEMARSAGSMDGLSQLEESLNKQTTHLRNSNPPGYQVTDNDMSALVERALAEVDADLGKCDPKGVQRTATGFKICL